MPLLPISSPNHQSTASNSVQLRAPVFSPRSGDPGTKVTVDTSDLPALTPVYLGLGATRSSFEVLVELVTDEAGRMSSVVSVPSWATTDRAHYFVLVDVYFRPLAVSEAFHVTDQQGSVTRRGRITDESDDCVTMQEEGETEELYILLGDTKGLTVGDEIVVKGTLSDAASCQEGTALEVIQRLSQ